MNGHNSMYNLLMGNNPVSTLPSSYNALGRTFGVSSANNASDDNFFAKRAKSLENAFGTTGATIAAGINEEIERRKNAERAKKFDQKMEDVYESNGFDDVDHYYNSKEAAEKDAFRKIGFDIDSYWNNRANADIAGDKDTVARLDQEYNAAKAKLTGNDANIINNFDEIQNQLKAQSTANYNEAKKAAEDYADYRQNSYIGQKTNQDRGKFAGSAINTLSTMFDVMAPGAGVLANSVQGGIEGIADELEQNGLKDFNWERAGQNALIGATTGAVTGGLNKGISNQLAKNGGNLFKGGNAITRGLNNLGSSTTAGRIGSTLATGAARGAVSGAVGGATGAGLSAAMNGQDVLGSAIEGAQRGFGQGALAGSVMAGANMAANATPGVRNVMQTLNQAGEDFKNSGDNTIERLKNTWNSGESPVANTAKSLGAGLADAVDMSKGTKQGYIQLPFSENRAPMTQAEEDIINIRNRNMDTIRRMTDFDDGIYTSDRRLRENPELARLINEGKLVKVTDEDGWDGINHIPMDRYKINEDALWTDKDISDMARYYNDEEYGYVDKNGEYHPDGKVVLQDTSLSPNQMSILDQSYVQNLPKNTNSKVQISVNSNGNDQYDIPVRRGAFKRILEDVNNRGVGLSVKDVSNEQPMPQDVQNMRVNNPYNTDTEQPTRILTQDQVAMQKIDNQDTIKAAKQRLKDVKADALRTRAAEDLLNQAGTAKSRAAQADNMVENVKAFMDAGLTKPEEWQLAADMVTGQSGVLSKMHRNLVNQAGEVDTFSGKGGQYGSGIEDTINYYIKKSGMTDSHGKAMYNEIMGVIDSLPSRLDGSLNMTDNASDVMKAIRELEAHRRNYLGEDSGNYATSDPFKRQKAKVIDNITSLLEGRVYDNIPDATKVITPDAVQELKNAFPGNEKWAREVDATFDNIKTGKDLRAAQKMFVQTSDYLKNIRQNYGTYGQKVGDAYGNALSQGLKKVPIIGGFASEIANSPAANRVFANINSARADRLEGNPVDFISRKTVNDNIGGNGGGNGGDGGNAIIPTNNEGNSIPNNVVETAYNPSTRVYEAIGRTEGLSNAEQARTADYLVNATQEANAQNNGNTLESLFGQPTTTNNTGVYNSIYGSTGQQTQNNTQTSGTITGNNLGNANTNTSIGNVQTYFPKTGDYWTDIIGIAMTNSINDGDYSTFGALYEMYQSQLANLKKNSGKDYNDVTNWNSSDRTKLLSAQNAMDQIDQLESAYNTATGGNGSNAIQGGLRTIAANIFGGNLDPSANNYNKLAESVGMGIVKNLINLGVTEADAKRYLEYLPALTDTKEQAAQKLDTLRNIYQSQINNLYSAYGV